jgi:large subunit ribosomal protein L10
LRKADKELKITELKKMAEAAGGLVLIGLSGVGAQQMAGLRGKVRESGCAIKVARNTLLRRALQGTPAQALEDRLVGPLGVVACGEDLIGGAKVALGLEMAAQGLRVRAGFLANKVRSRDEVAAIANLPSKEVILGQLVYLLQSPVSKIIQTLEQPIRNLVNIAQIAAQKKAEA